MGELLRRIYKISPYDTQLLAVLALIKKPEQLKGRIAQIKTGEGKSTIIAILSAFFALKGHVIDVVTSAPNLAARDCEKYRPFYQALGLTANSVGSQAQAGDLEAHIVYGINTTFEFALLNDGLNQEGLRYLAVDKPRPYDVVIVDEVDNLFIDMALSSALLSISGNETIAWVYQPILSFIKELGAQNKLAEAEDLRQFLFKNVSQYSSEIKALSEKRLQRWLKNARVALYVKKEQEDYIVNKKINDIQIMDFENTGHIQEGCQWGGGLHQLLQAKHELPITSEALTAASVAHPSYFLSYQHIIGLTGTIGELTEKEEIEKNYQLGCFSIPPHFPCQRNHLTSVLSNDGKIHQQAILANLLEHQKMGKPILVLFKTIRASQEFSEFLQIQSIRHQLINAIQKEDEHYLIARAGEEGIITIATNITGRGTDFILSPASKKNGGLHMIFTFYPANKRVEEQGFGRAGRQGQPGTCLLILNKQEKGIQALIPSLEIVDIVVLDTIRSLYIKNQSEQRSIISRKELLYFKMLNQFFKQLNALSTLFENKAFQRQLETLCQTFEPSNDENSSLIPHHSRWLPIIETIKDHKTQTTPSDWKPVLKAFKKVYIDELRTLWATFYNKLHDDITTNDLNFAEILMMQQYELIKSALESKLHFPEESVTLFLKEILTIAEVNTARPINFIAY